jgi:hypothetical protein
MSGEFGNFDARQVEPSVGFSGEPIPAGQYRAQIVKSEWKANKAGSGRYCEFVFEILTGDQKGRRIWSRLNLENPNAQAVSMARAELSAICHAVGVMSPKAPQQLFNIPLVIGVKVVARKDKPGEYSNAIGEYLSTEKAKTGTPTVAANVGNDDSPF